MVQLELEVVVVGLGSEADFLDDDLGGLGLLVFQTFFLVEDELLVVHRLADGRIGIGLNLNEIDTQFLYDSQGISQGIDVGFHTLTYQSHHRGFDFLVDAVVESVLVFVRPLAGSSSLWNLCYDFSLLY